MAEGATTLKGLRAQMGKKMTAWHFIFTPGCVTKTQLSLRNLCRQLPPAGLFERVVPRPALRATDVSSAAPPSGLSADNGCRKNVELLPSHELF